MKNENRKIAISTNGKLPSIANRLRETISEDLTDRLDAVLVCMYEICQQLKEDFDHKIKILNVLTTGWNSTRKPFLKPVCYFKKKAFLWSMFVMLLMVVCHCFFSYTTLVRDFADDY
ncbi:MAG: hypothetical protein ACMUEM_00515 [Flavobacteriales bacterium AspAUS03]